MVLHELAVHTIPNEIFTKLGKAAAISAISSSVKPKPHPSEREQRDRSERRTSPWNSITGDIEAASTTIITKQTRVASFLPGP